MTVATGSCRSCFARRTSPCQRPGRFPCTDLRVSLRHVSEIRAAAIVTNVGSWASPSRVRPPTTSTRPSSGVWRNGTDCEPDWASGIGRRPDEDLVVLGPVGGLIVVDQTGRTFSIRSGCGRWFPAFGDALSIPRHVTCG